MRNEILASLRLAVILTVLTGLLYPLAMFLAAQTLFPEQANGSLIRRGETIVGSRLIGQKFSAPRYLHPRPSACDYDASASAATNLGPTSDRLLHGDKDFAGVEQLAAQVRRENGLAAAALVPVDAVTRSASGLDPDVSLAYADLQVARIARERGLPEARVREAVTSATHGRALGFIGEPAVNVLEANLALDATGK
jgi:K+-transporting ATPase ATPase C chain